MWEESVETLRGEYFHERVDAAGYSCADGVRAERRVRLSSKTLGLYGVADIVEFSRQNDRTKIVPIEYKVGRPKRGNWDRVQVAAQAVCLEEMYGEAVGEGCIFYGELRRRDVVVVDDKLREQVCDLTRRMHQLLDSEVLPKAVYGNRCKRCSLMDNCMPRVLPLDVQSYWKQMDEGW
jgi:CRISPR-associated exonuclease Cas4